MTAIGHDSLKTEKTLTVDGKVYKYFSVAEAAAKLGDISKLPKTLKSCWKTCCASKTAAATRWMTPNP